MKKHRTLKFFISLGLIVLVLAGIFVGGYFILDKAVVPKYFGKFGINNMSELVGMMTTLYSNKDEDDIVTHGHTENDRNVAESKLIEKGVPALSNGRLDYNAFANGDVEVAANSVIMLTDRELASIINEMLKTGMLADRLPNLKYINTLNMEMLELIITPEKIDGVLNKNKADVKFTIKIDTTSIRGQMAVEMGMPLFLLNMIVPKTLYLTNTVTLTNNDGEWSYVGGDIGINGKTTEKSKILLNLLISFIFPEEDEMTTEKLQENLGEVLIKSTDMLGSIEFSDNINSTNQNGVVLTTK